MSSFFPSRWFVALSFVGAGAFAGSIISRICVSVAPPPGLVDFAFMMLVTSAWVYAAAHSLERRQQALIRMKNAHELADLADSLRSRRPEVVDFIRLLDKIVADLYPVQHRPLTRVDLAGVTAHVRETVVRRLRADEKPEDIQSVGLITPTQWRATIVRKRGDEEIRRIVDVSLDEIVTACGRLSSEKLS